MSERWLPVVGYEGYYEVSDQGRVRSLTRRVPHGQRWKVMAGKILAGSPGAHGYPVVTLSKLGKTRTRTVHSLVLVAFVGPRPSGMVGSPLEVCHRDDNKLNNTVGNLYWGTRRANIQDAIANGKHGQASKPKCPKGHDYDEQNTYRTARNGWRYCRECTRDRNREQRAKRRSVLERGHEVGTSGE